MRRILAVTSGRADATPMEPVIRALNDRCVVEHRDVAKSCLEEIVECIDYDKADIVLLLGDRYEMGLAALASTFAKTPIAHIHGGEASFGSFDNQIRDAVTKLSHIHFVAHVPAASRLQHQLGENPHRIVITGAPGLDNLTDLPERKPEKYFVCTYHPATLEKESGIDALIEALDRFPDYKAIWTGVNDDPGSNNIKRVLAGRDIRVLGPRDYHLLCRDAAAVVGNSSSGIIEAPTLEVPTVNVGSRQDGRLKGPSVFDCKETSIGCISWAIHMALDYEGLFENPYGGPGASAKIADILSNISLDGILVKRWSA